MKAHDVMTWGAITVGPDESVTHAVQLMLQNKISGLPVVDDNEQLVGMVTEGDFLRRGELGTQRQRPRWLEFLLGPGRLASEYVQARGQKVGQVMTPEPKTITPETPLGEIVRLMEHHRVKRLPVVQDGKLVGIVSRWRRRDNPRADHGRMCQATMGPSHQCGGARWRSRALGRDHR